MTHWIDPHPVDASPLERLGLHPLVAQTLIRRGHATPDSARAFLDPLHAPLTPATALPGMDAALERIASALRAGEPICVWGDFDVDGQTATTLLVQTLQLLGANVTYYIPVRGRESHGVHIESLKPIVDNGAKLILTCDTGITAHKAIDYANSRNVDVIVTDHHDLGETLPNAAAIVNPKALPHEHPLANLPGAGVAYKLAEALLSKGHESETKGLLDLAALGIIADLALLKGETRSIAQKGIDALRKTDRLGLKVMAELASLDLSQATEESIGFTLGPRLNALGRLSDANPAVELLTTRDPVRARVLAAQIEGLNTQRRLLTDQVHQAAEAQLRADPSLLTQPMILLSHPAWPGGVVGIVANRLVERYHKPTLLLTESEDGILRGSARSIEGLHITEAIAACKEHLLNFGGHPMAAGLSLEREQLPAFRKALNKAVEKMLSKAELEEETLEVDAWLSLEDLSLELAGQIERLAPFGPGNPALLLATRGLRLQSAADIGRTKEHRRLVVANENGTEQEVLWWNGAGEDLPEALTGAGGKFDLAFSMRANTFRGERRITLEFEDLRPVEEKPVEIRKPKVEIRDLRRDLEKLASLKAETLVWAEGPDRPKGADRFNLRRADEFAIWTTPPSPAELHAALEIVKPGRIYLFGVAPAQEKTDEFLTRLAGMAKFSINRRNGSLNLPELAATTAQREASVRLGLEWLAAGGHLRIEDEDGQLQLFPSEGIADRYAQSELYAGVKGLLEETNAYRAHFARAEVNSLFKP